MYNDFADYLEKNCDIKDQYVKYYLYWLNEFVKYCNEKKFDLKSNYIKEFLQVLSMKYEDWQVKQAIYLLIFN